MLNVLLRLTSERFMFWGLSLESLEIHVKCICIKVKETHLLTPNFCYLLKNTGCTVDINWNSMFYSNVATNEHLAKLYQQNAEELGLTFPSREEQAKMAFGSTDMGNVSHVKPSIHPFFDIETSAANHTREFTVASATKEAHSRAVLQAKVLAMMALDVLCNDQIWESVVTDFEEDHGRMKPRVT